MFDMKTIVFSYLLTNVLITWFIAVLWVQNRKRYAGLAFWLVDFILQAVGLLFISFRGVAPDLVSIVIAQMLIAGGMLCLYIGLERFVGKAGTQIHNYGIVAGYVGLIAYFTFIQPDIDIRTILLSAITILLTGQCAWLLLRRAAPALRPITRAAGIVFLLYTLNAFVRIIELIHTPLAAASGLFETPSIQVAFVFFNQLLCIALTFTLIMMVTRRLELDVQTQSAERIRAEQASAESQKRFALAFRTSPYAITITRASDGQIIEVNEGFTNITGYSAAECIGRTTLGLNLWVEEQDRARVVAELAKGNPVSGMEFRFRKKDGAILTGMISANVFMLGDQTCILSSINDITERKRAEESLLASEARYRAVTQTAHDAIISADSVGDIIGWNQGAENIFGHSEAEAIGQALSILVPGQYGRQHLTGIQRLQAGEAPRLIGKTIEVTGRRKDGSEFPLELSLSEWQVAEGRFFTGIIRDITARRLAEEEIKQLSIHDALTGLYNRRFFEEEMTRLERGRQFPISIVMADLNHLKNINDRDGHAEGDVLLQRAAQVLKSAFRGEDIIARIGGDEFAVLLPGSDAASAGQTLRRIRRMLGEHNAAHSGTPLSIALGASTAQHGGALMDTLKEADMRMYEEKNGNTTYKQKMR